MTLGKNSSVVFEGEFEGLWNPSLDVRDLPEEELMLS